MGGLHVGQAGYGIECASSDLIFQCCVVVRCACAGGANLQVASDAQWELGTGEARHLANLHRQRLHRDQWDEICWQRAQAASAARPVSAVAHVPPKIPFYEKPKSIL